MEVRGLVDCKLTYLHCPLTCNSLHNELNLCFGCVCVGGSGEGVAGTEGENT